MISPVPPYTPTVLTKTKRPNYQSFFLRQLGHAETYSVSAAFRPLLTEGLVLSGIDYPNLSIVFGLVIDTPLSVKILSPRVQ